MMLPGFVAWVPIAIAFASWFIVAETYPRSYLSDEEADSLRTIHAIIRFRKKKGKDI